VCQDGGQGIGRRISKGDSKQDLKDGVNTSGTKIIGRKKSGKSKTKKNNEKLGQAKIAGNHGRKDPKVGVKRGGTIKKKKRPTVCTRKKQLGQKIGETKNILNMDVGLSIKAPSQGGLGKKRGRMNLGCS